MSGSQLIAMRIFLVDQQDCTLTPLTDLHVPLRPGSLLKWIGFSREGMLFSQDSSGNIRALNLESNEWTSLSVSEIEEHRKVWPIGITNYELLFWKTTDEDPEPTVAPRFNLKKGVFYIPTVGIYP